MTKILEQKLFGVDFHNPVFSASGAFGYGRDYLDFVAPEQLGAVVTKGTSNVPWVGNKTPRVMETASGMLNSIGLENPGMDHFLNVDLPFLRERDARVILNVVGKTPEEYLAVVKRLENVSGVDALEINISCPNVTAGGIAFGTDAKVAAGLVSLLREATDLPLIVKLSPNVTDIVEIALAVEEAGADSVSLINTLSGMAIDIRTKKPFLGNVFGGLSGPAIKPVALRMVYLVSQKLKVPVIGMGGIMNWQDAVEFFLAGASAVNVGTAVFVNPRVHLEIISGLERYLRDNNYSHISDIIGMAWKGQ